MILVCSHVLWTKIKVLSLHLFVWHLYGNLKLLLHDVIKDFSPRLVRQYIGPTKVIGGDEIENIPTECFV